MTLKSSLLMIVLWMIIIVAGTAGCTKAEPMSNVPEKAAEDTKAETEEVVKAAPAVEEIEIEETASEDSYPIVIVHAFGETIIEEKPERVVTISWGNQDVPLALGVVPVGVSMANYGVIDDSGLLPWTKEAFAALDVNGPNIFDDAMALDYEAINDAQPDVILAAYSGITEEEYQLLSEIAPVVAYPRQAWQTFWREQILTDATGMGMASEGQALIKNLEELIAKKSEAYPQIQGKSAAFFWFNPADLGKFYVYLPADPRVAYLEDLGMTFPESVLALSESSDSFALELSAENVDILEDIDIIITYGDDSVLPALQADALIGTVPAVQRGSVVIVTDGTPLAASGTPSALSIPATIDDYLALIAEVADKVE